MITRVPGSRHILKQQLFKQTFPNSRTSVTVTSTSVTVTSTSVTVTSTSSTSMTATSTSSTSVTATSTSVTATSTSVTATTTSVSATSTSATSTVTSYTENQETEQGAGGFVSCSCQGCKFLKNLAYNMQSGFLVHVFSDICIF